jgi:hypothetical protein
MQVGGSGGGSGLVFDSTEFGQLHVTGVAKFYAGSTTGTQRGDLVLQTLSINPTNTPSVAFLVGSGNNALVQGAVAPTTSGGILRIGDATDLTWRPGSILISGALGTATYSGGAYTDVHAFNELRLAARQDILMGSPRFISLIQGTAIGDIDIAAGRPQGVGPALDEQFKIFAATGRLEVSAENKVVQQNTAPFGGTQTSGLFLTGAANPALIIDPPKLIELYGAFNGADGKPVNGQQAGSTITFQVVDASGNPTAKPSDANYKFNSCSVGTSTCATIVPSGGTTAGGSSGGSSSGNSFTSQISSGVLTARDGLGPNGTPGGGPTSGPPNSAEGDGRSSEEQALAQLGSDLANPPVLLGVAPVDSDEIVTDPVTTGAGSEEIWRQNRQKK